MAMKMTKTTTATSMTEPIAAIVTLTPPHRALLARTAPHQWVRTLRRLLREGEMAAAAVAGGGTGPAASPPKHEVVLKGTPAEVRQRVKAEDAAWRDAKGWSLLFYAAGRRGGSAKDSAEVCRILIDELGFDPELQSSRDSLAQTALFYAARSGVVDAASMLLDRKANIDKADIINQTAIYWAASWGNRPVLELLLARRANIMHRDVNGQTALFYAVKLGATVSPDTQVECVKALLEYAADRKALVSVKCQKTGQTALFNAVRFGGTLDTCGLLLDASADVDEVDLRGQSALFYAAAARSECVGFLLERGAVVDLRDANLETALGYAVSKGQVDSCRLLLGGKADPNLKSRQGVSPADVALQPALGAPRPEELLEMFRALGCKAPTTPLQNVMAMTPRSSKRRRKPLDGEDDDAGSAVGSVVSSVVPAGRGSPKLRRTNTGSPTRSQVGKAVGDTGSAVGAPVPSCTSELCRAALHGSAADVARLLSAGHSSSEVDAASSANLLGLAARRAPADDGVAKQICTLLVEEHKLDVSTADGSARTPLFHAVGGRLAACAEYLLTARADANAKDKNGNCPLAVAAAAGQVSMVELLVRHGAETRDALLVCAAPCVAPLVAAKCDPNACGTDGHQGEPLV